MLFLYSKGQKETSGRQKYVVKEGRYRTVIRHVTIVSSIDNKISVESASLYNDMLNLSHLSDNSIINTN